ncbi:MAG TPA: hypothetical protein PLX25_00460 [Sphaerochaeta sp.]|jgi:hypothetical protein|nr:hypothetical protein [Sphaerochaeta sp.]
MRITTGGSGSWGVIDGLLDPIRVPRFARVRQIFDAPGPIDVTRSLVGQLADDRWWGALKPGESVAIAVGSRGIDSQVEAVRTLVAEIRGRGGVPFIVPAMGSHAGATAEGQMAMLHALGFTEEHVGCPIRSSMETVQLGRAGEDDLPVLTDRIAHEADHLVLINRIKEHVCFRGPYESGLMKMITIGLGKQQGAEIAHNLGFGRMASHITDIASEALRHLKLLFAVGMVENAAHQACLIEVMDGPSIPVREAVLLRLAKQYGARLHLDRFDALIIDEIGKHISGSGFDTNVVGRYHSCWIEGGPEIQRVAILDIAAESKGNGNGLGMGDFTTVRAAEKFDFAQTYPNTLTALLTGGVKIPMVLPNDRQVLQACMKTCHHQNWADTTVIRIHNTLSLEEIEVSENLLPVIGNDERFEILSDPYELSFDDQGNLF